MPPTFSIRACWTGLSITALAVVMLAGPSACGLGATSPEDCPGEPAGEARDNCWLEHATTLFRETDDRSAAIATIQAQVEDPRVRDFIWLSITREVDPSSFVYCKMIEEQALAERCRVLVSRPHLHRELVGGGGAGPGGPPAGRGPGAGPGGPPPGGGPPPRGKADPPPPK